ncbi:MAG: adenine phosphoribosyltransferase [Burkholderiales bacterium]|nr:adenine phosphoribosyltransferase [Burkholderiales bacterium]
MQEHIKSLIRTIPDFPHPGIQFRDITTLFNDAAGFRLTIDALVARYAGQAISKVAGIESRGFILAAPLALALGAGFVPIRKPGKLPAERIGLDYQLEYGTDRVEVHVDAIGRDERVLLVDDLIATGGTALAAATLIETLGGKVVECAFVIDLPALGGRKRLSACGYGSIALCAFDGE